MAYLKYMAYSRWADPTTKQTDTGLGLLALIPVSVDRIWLLRTIRKEEADRQARKIRINAAGAGRVVEIDRAVGRHGFGACIAKTGSTRASTACFRNAHLF
jgi:hypothetical protein